MSGQATRTTSGVPFWSMSPTAGQPSLPLPSMFFHSCVSETTGGLPGAQLMVHASRPVMSSGLPSPVRSAKVGRPPM